MLFVCRKLLTTAAMCLIAFAAIAKLADLPAFLVSLEQWKLVPAWARVYVGLCVPLTELCISIAWLIGLGGRRLRLAAIALVVVLTSAFLTEAILNRPPACECFCKWLAWKRWQGSVPWVLGRNFVPLVALVIGADTAFSLPKIKLRPPRSMPKRAGFTLLELIISIALVALLVALVLPSFKSIGIASRDVKSLSNLRQHCQIVAFYAASESDALPCQVKPEATHTILRAGGDIELLCAYFDIRVAWTIGMADAYYDGRWEHASYYVPTRYSGTPWTYWYTVTAVAAPEYWNPSTRMLDGQFAGQSIANVTFPSSKGLYLDVFDGGRRGYESTVPIFWPMGFVDGSARRVKDENIIRPYPKGDGEPGVGRGRLIIGYPAIHTIDGIRGRDVK